MNRSVGFLILSATALLAGAALLITRETPSKAARNERTESSAARLAAAPTTPSPVASPALPAPTPVASTPAKPAPGEAAFMAELRDLLKASPGRAFELARSGSERFGDSAGAAERSWVMVKALSELGRHDEARAEGKKLLERYRDTRWGEDVYRHLFVNPATHPAERGFGKTLEGD